MKNSFACFIAALALFSLGCDGAEYDRVTVKVKLVNSSDSLRRQVELSEVSVTLASTQGETQPAAVEKIYTQLPQVVVNASSADALASQWQPIYNSHALNFGESEWLDSQAATTLWNGIEPDSASVRVVYKKVDSSIYCVFEGLAASVETTISEGSSYEKSCNSDLNCPQDGANLISIAQDIAHLVTIDIGQVECSAAK